jgi:disulfide bond formation protein DsbB
MSPDTVETFYALLALLAIGAMATVVVVRLLAFVSPAARGWYGAIAQLVRPNAVGMAFWAALLATLGSLYFSEVAHFEPCKLCWYQRIAMYPLVLILGIAAVRRDPGVRVYAMALAAIGALIAMYHVALEWIPALDTGACGTGPACSIIWFRALGFISLPTLALVAFLFILTLLSIQGSDAAAGDDLDDGPSERSPA